MNAETALTRKKAQKVLKKLKKLDGKHYIEPKVTTSLDGSNT